MNRNNFLIVINILIIAFYLYVLVCKSCSQIYFWWDSFLNSFVALLFVSILYLIQIISGLISKQNNYFKFINYLSVINSVISIFYWIFVLWVFSFGAFSYIIMVLLFIVHTYFSLFFKIYSIP